MNKTQLIDNIAHQSDITKKEAAAALEAMLSTITEALSEEDEVALIGFGTFKISHRPARTGRNPATNEPLEIPAKKAVTFKPGKPLKELVNQ